MSDILGNLHRSECPTTLTWPDYVTTLMSNSAGAIYTKTTTVAIDPFVISEAKTTGKSNVQILTFSSLTKANKILRLKDTKTREDTMVSNETGG